ncbi:hypothetical protein H257_19304 [Aphanomyces astaci]|uniref:Secreted protein n=1 Tax=Aphanomyces astaci TaxID=112090 RepID=W4FAD1_APHAT|nr:hypothetical protein H257_19304 [Aphanomyces astaci]ETV63766.1 hypothetical protein H257_19304 [Aphanomyces astaci]|eukprot:XP_009846752.1 hypothetical protein H257_19304 [Aphanomyces astaci]
MNMSMQFLCNMTFTVIAAGAVQMVVVPDPSSRETATQRRRRQREASVQRRFQVYEDRLSSNRNGRNDRPYYDDRRNDRPYYHDRRNAEYSFSGRVVVAAAVAVFEAVEGAAAPGLLRVKMTAAAAHTRRPIQMTAAKCKLETPDGVLHHH